VLDVLGYLAEKGGSLGEDAWEEVRERGGRGGGGGGGGEEEGEEGKEEGSLGGGIPTPHNWFSG